MCRVFYLAICLLMIVPGSAIADEADQEPKSTTESQLDIIDRGIVKRDAAIRLDPMSWELYFQRATLWEAKEEYLKAISDY